MYYRLTYSRLVQLVVKAHVIKLLVSSLSVWSLDWPLGGVDIAVAVISSIYGNKMIHWIRNQMGVKPWCSVIITLVTESGCWGK